jgi:hypothetical protein
MANPLQSVGVSVKLQIVVAALLGWFWLLCGAAAADTLHHWVQLGDDSRVIVRAIVRAGTCPKLLVDGKAVTMQLRAAQTARYSGLVCEESLPRPAPEMVLDGKVLPVLRADLRRIAVIGDTGCRIKGSWAQACDDTDAWPLDAVMAAIVKLQPDLVIHVGDYLYRDSPCPPSADCVGSPYGDGLQTWVADWFGPAQQLLSKTPFIFVRGNHEACGRNDKGWFRYLAVGPIPTDCPAVSESWNAVLGGTNLIVFDASDGPSAHSSVRHLEVYRRMAEAAFANLDRETWFLTHRPIWAHLRAFGEIIDGDDTQRDAFGDGFPQAVSLILSGHLHGFQAIDLANRPAQVISGNGGTELDPMPNEDKRNREIAGSQARQVLSDAGFGFLLLDRDGESDWWADVFDAQGDRRHSCHLSGRGFSCGARSQ